MASHLLPPSPPPTPTAITDLTDDLLREIFLRLPALPSLVRAAFACRDFRRAVRSSPAFRRSFRALHAPPLLAFFLDRNMEALAVSPWRRRSDPGIVDTDFFGIHLSRHGDPGATGWEIHSEFPCTDGYFNLESGSTKNTANYCPLTLALDLFIYQPDFVHFEFYTVLSEDGQRPSRVVCVRHERPLAESTAVVFSSDTMDWQISRKTTLRLLKPERIRTAMVVRGLICWQGWMYDQIVVLDTATCQFSLIDLPTPLKAEYFATYKLGETKDEKFCIVDKMEYTLVSWFMTTNDDSVVERWMMYRKFPLHPIVKEFTGCSIEDESCDVRVDIVAVIDGFVYLRIFYCKVTEYYNLDLSICLETSEISELFHGAYRDTIEAHPYVMAWPPSLLQSKEEPETEFTGDSVADNRPLCTEEASTVLVNALQSFRQALMNDSDNNNEIVAKLDAFLGPTEDEEGSLIRKINTLDAQLRTARNRIFRISA